MILCKLVSSADRFIEGLVSSIYLRFRQKAIGGCAKELTKQYTASEELKELGVCDRIVAEPLGGAQRSPQETAARIKQQLITQLDKLSAHSSDELLEARYQRLMSFGIQ